jgi:hypothetical protein
MNKLDEIFRIANNVLFFDDNSDYGTALWEILAIIKPEMFINDDEPELEYIEKENK